MPADASPSSDDPVSPGGLSGKTALVTGSVALGAVLTGSLLRTFRHAHRPTPASLPNALEANVREAEIMEGRVRYYARPGTGTPLVLLHSINAAGSSFEMKPLFDHFAATTERPLYALDWLGFGLSDRPPVDYRPELYQRQLRRFLSETLHEPADLIALSLAGEYAAAVATDSPFLVRHLVLIAPTSLEPESGPSLWQWGLVKAANRFGAFELFFDRLTRPDPLRSFYQRRIFRDPSQVPEDLVNYAQVTSRARGAHHAPSHFIAGRLFMYEQAWLAYTRLAVPTLIIAPEQADGLVQRFDRLPELIRHNVDIRAHRLPSGLLPQWEHPSLLLNVLTPFLA